MHERQRVGLVIGQGIVLFYYLLMLLSAGSFCGLRMHFNSRRLIQEATEADELFQEAYSW